MGLAGVVVLFASKFPLVAALTIDIARDDLSAVVGVVGAEGVAAGIPI